MNELQSLFKDKNDIQSVIDGVSSGLKEQLISGISGSARSLLISTIYGVKKRPILIVTHQLLQAQQLYDDLVELTDDSSVFLYPVNELIASEMAIASPELKVERIRSLTKWLASDRGILIAPIAALKRKLPPLSYWETYELMFHDGDVINLSLIQSQLIDMGYERVEMVTAPMEFSVRGGIIDIYPVTVKDPVRIELFDDEIDSIRFFEAQTQRSLSKGDSVIVGPAHEYILTEQDYLRAAQRLEQLLFDTVKKGKKSGQTEDLVASVEADLELLKNRQSFQGMYKYSNLFYDEPASLLEYLPENGLVIFDEFGRVQELAQSLDKQESDYYVTLMEQQEAVPNLAFSFDWFDVREKLVHQRLYMSVFLRHTPNTQPENVVNLATHPMQEFHSQIQLFKSELERWHKLDYKLFILVENETRAKKVQSILMEYDIRADISQDVVTNKKVPVIMVKNISQGIEFPTYKFALITEREIFNRKQPRNRNRMTLSNAERIKSYQELKVGDYVVHRDHGIGKYLGIETLQVNKLNKDYLLIQYSGDDKLYVPIDQIDLIQRYVGSEGKKPRVYKLGGTEWARVKRRVQSSVEDIADELIKLYAERQTREGFAFDHDSELQQEFEHAFAYQETPDQLKSVAEIKADMEKARPMDRLLCGDVGYGKTEVAIRAIFKAVVEGKQVAVLVPTTILAQQHYQTMMERFQDYPIKIGLLSRFRTRKQQNETLKALQVGTVDVVIGTHRLLSKDVQYKDLGLLVVDEEQRFGVKHKEAIKQIKTNVDVLTLTATPIPRTLHMSMLGIRDLSIIETPPKNRFPIQTYVMEQNSVLIKEVIEREIARGGQVYLLYNRIDRIEKVAREISDLVESARVTIAHGRMNEAELENVMFSFLEGESDVLVSTTIIETGVDIPNVNTLLVYNADHMGLSQLYQLRGRVGRSNRVAYAYFMYQKDKVLTEVAEKRLQAIKEFTELGSGFKIAMRDLSIRGAGNLLGAEQHGFIDSVGFDLYSQMLKEAVEARKTGKRTEEIAPFNPEIMISVDAYIPTNYIQDEQQKIDVYKKFQSLQSDDDIADLQDELIDRYGDYPDEVGQLFLISKLRMYAKRERIESMNEKGKKIELLIEDTRSQRIDGAKLFELANSFGRLIQLGTVNQQLKITFNWQREPLTEKLEMMMTFIRKLNDVDFDEQKKPMNV